MTTNPLFNPYNLGQQYRPGVSSSMALALLPTDNFAQKRADAAAAVQYQSMLSGLAEQAAAEKEKALTDTQATLDTIDNQGLLQADTRRLNAMYTDPWRARIEDEIVNKYGGDIVKFKRERQPYLLKTLYRQLQESPDFQNALTNKTNYALIKKAQADGKLVVGNSDQDWTDFVSGRTTTLPFRGSYDAPKEGFDYFDKNAHPYYPYGMSGKPAEVTQDDLHKHLLSQGLSPAQSMDYISKLGYRGGRYWKMDQQKPWEAQKTAFDQQMDRLNYQQRGAGQAETRRHNLATEAREARKEAREAPAGSTLGAADFLFNPEASGAIRDQSGAYGRSMLVTKGVSGNLRDQAMRAAGIDPNGGGFLSPSKDVTNKTGYSSTVKEVYSLSGRPMARTNGQPFVFKRVDGSEVIFDPATNQPFIKATISETGKGDVDVLVPLANTTAAKFSANDQTGLNDSKYEVSQNQGALDREAASRQRSREGATKANERLNNLPDWFK